MSEEIFAANNIEYKLQNGATIISDVSLKLNVGKISALVGPSGAGKTTFARISSGLIRQTSGMIVCDDHEILKPSRRCILLDQELILFPWMKCIDHVKFGLPRPLPANWLSRAEELLADVGLDKFINQFPYQLSGGMKQRLALARAMAATPVVLLLDEPFSSLDVGGRQALEELLCSIVAQGHVSAVLLITHDIREAIYVADDIYVVSSCPARVMRRFDISFSRPRTENIRQDIDFIRLQSEIEGEIIQMGHEA